MAKPTRRDVHIDQALTNISIAVRPTGFVARDIFPIVPVQHVSDKYWIFDKWSWFRDEAQIRAPATRAARADFILSTGSYVCVEYAVAHVIPDEVRENADNPLRPEIEGTEFVTTKLYIALERRVASLVTASSNWTNSASPDTTWDLDTSDPIGDVETARMAIMEEIGIFPNVMVISACVYSHLKQHPDLLDRIKYTQRGVLTPELMAGLFDVERILIAPAVYNAAKEGQSGSMAWVWGDNVWMGYVPRRPSLMTPAAGYIFQWKNFEVRRYREEQEHADVIEARHSVDEVITGSDAGYLIFNAVA